MDHESGEQRLRYFYEAVACGTVRSAADKLDVNPSTVSRQIAQLEEELAVTLIERHSRGMKPTEAGQLVIEHYRQQRAHREDLIAKLREIGGLQRGHLSIALGEGFVSDLLAEPLQLFWRRYPNLTIAMETGGTNDVIRMVAEDMAHFGLVYNPPQEPRIRSQVASRQPMCVIVPPGHPLTRLDRPLRVAELAGFPIALMLSAFGIRQIVDLVEYRSKFRFAPSLTTNSIAVLKHFVRAGLGITLLPAFAVAQESGAGELGALPVDDPVMEAAEACIVTRLGRQLPAAAVRLTAHLTSNMTAFRPAP